MKNDESPEPTREEIVEKWKKRAEVTIRTTWKPTVAGIINIVNGILLFLLGSFYGIFYMSCIRYTGENGSVLVRGILFMVLGMLAMVGALYALQRKKWGWALAISICCAIGALGAVFDFYANSAGFSYIYAGFGVLGIPAIVLTALSKDEFE